MKNYVVIDNALDDDIAQLIKKTMTGPDFPWFYTNTVARSIDKKDIDLKQYYFTHLFYQDGSWNSDFASQIISPISKAINARAFIRVKGNFYPRADEIVENPPHADYSFSHGGAIYYVNSNDGFTILDDGTKIESVENRILLFDPSTLHHSTHCTDQHGRINININFF